MRDSELKADVRELQNLAHDLNNTIHVIVSSLTVLRDRKLAETAARRAMALTRGMLDSPVAARLPLERLRMNLVTNGRDAMKEGGELMVHTQLIDIEGKSSVEWRVADSGTGLAPEIAANAFATGVSTKPRSQGRGLGLAIWRDIVGRHGGVVFLESPAQGGVVAHALLPVARVSA